MLVWSKQQNLYTLCGIILITTGLYFPIFSQPMWFSIIGKIGQAVNAGDSGHLILASALTSFLHSVQSLFFFLATILIIYFAGYRFKWKRWQTSLVSLPVIVVLHWINSFIHNLPWEPVPTVLSTVISILLLERIFRETNNLLQIFIVSAQVFFAFQWLNIMPLLSIYYFGTSDIPFSIKTAGIYLRASSVLNFTGFAFFLPFISSAFVTTILFISYSRNIRMMAENHRKEKEIQHMRVKALENRIYQELHSLVHDLKTPLATIQGLNSLILMTKSTEKLEEYCERIDSSVVKMNEMISGILYESARQKLKVTDLINYIRAQLPLEDERVKIDIFIEENLPKIYVNKIRVARAVINLLENAIMAPCKHPYKQIKLIVKSHDRGILIQVQDNAIGIKESELSRIWEAGYSTRNSSGLGLPFAKQIIESHNGWIDIKSQLDIGTTVSLYLPSAVNWAEV